MENKIADPSNNNIVRNWLSGIGIALVVMILITYLIHRSDNPGAVPVADDATSTAVAATTTKPAAEIVTYPSAGNTKTTDSMGETVTVEDQAAGKSVEISDMTITRKSWVAVKDTEGTILGAGLFPAGATTGEIPLLRATKAGQRYEVLIYVDDGDKVFNLHKDMVVTAADGSPVSAAFSAE